MDEAEHIKQYSKYSYFVFLFTREGGLKRGTCCFIRYNSKIYLLSNYHVIMGWDLGAYKSEYLPIELRIPYLGKGFDKKKFLRFDIRQVKQIDIVRWLHPDIMLIEIDPRKLAPDCRLNIIDIDSSMPPIQEGQRVFSIGYPEKGQYSTPPHDQKALYASGLYSIDYGDFEKVGLSTPRVNVEGYRKRFELMRFYFDGKSQKGMSGSPVFAETQGGYQFAGLLSSSYNTTGFTAAEKREVIIYYLDLMQKFKLTYLDYSQLVQHNFFEFTYPGESEF